MPRCEHCGSVAKSQALLDEHLSGCADARLPAPPKECPHCGMPTPRPFEHRNHLKACAHNPDIQSAMRSIQERRAAEEIVRAAQVDSRERKRRGTLRNVEGIPVELPISPPIALHFVPYPDGETCTVEVEGEPWELLFRSTDQRSTGDQPARSEFPVRLIPQLREVCSEEAEASGGGRWRIEWSGSGASSVWEKRSVQVSPDERRLEIHFHLESE